MDEIGTLKKIRNCPVVNVGLALSCEHCCSCCRCRWCH